MAWNILRAPQRQALWILLATQATPAWLFEPAKKDRMWLLSQPRWLSTDLAEQQGTGQEGLRGEGVTSPLPHRKLGNAKSRAEPGAAREGAAATRTPLDLAAVSRLAWSLHGSRASRLTGKEQMKVPIEHLTRSDAAALAAHPPHRHWAVKPTSGSISATHATCVTHKVSADCAKTQPGCAADALRAHFAWHHFGLGSHHCAHSASGPPRKGASRRRTGALKIKYPPTRLYYDRSREACPARPSRLPSSQITRAPLGCGSKLLILDGDIGVVRRCASHCERRLRWRLKRSSAQVQGRSAVAMHMPRRQ